MQSLTSLISNYMETVGFIKKLSWNTIKAYQIDLKQFAAFTKNTLADGDTIKRYIMHLNQRFAPRSVKRKIASVRAFYHDLSINGVLKKNPFEQLQIRVHTPKQLPRTIPQQIVHSILRSAYNEYRPGNRIVLRDIMILELLFSTGLRVSELIHLKAEDVNLSVGFLTCRDEHRERTIPFGKEVRAKGHFSTCMARKIAETVGQNKFRGVNGPHQ